MTKKIQQDLRKFKLIEPIGSDEEEFLSLLRWILISLTFLNGSFILPEKMPFTERRSI